MAYRSKELRREYLSRPEVAAKMWEYNHRPEVVQRRRDSQRAAYLKASAARYAKRRQDLAAKKEWLGIYYQRLADAEEEVGISPEILTTLEASELGIVACGLATLKVG